MEVKLNLIKPNLYTTNNEVYFGIDGSDVIPVSRSVDEIIKKHIGILKVKESDLDATKFGKGENKEGIYRVPLTKYLDIVEKKFEPESIAEYGLTNDSARLFGLSYFIHAKTIEDNLETINWLKLEQYLIDPDKTFKACGESELVCILDREKTLEEMKKLHEKLGLNIPDNFAKFSMVTGQVPYEKDELKLQNLGVISFAQLKAKDRTKIEEAKTTLVERLKEVDGPCLSFDAPQIYKQMMGLFADAPELIQKYGDILRTPLWKTRFFKLDP